MTHSHRIHISSRFSISSRFRVGIVCLGLLGGCDRESLPAGPAAKTPGQPATNNPASCPEALPTSGAACDLGSEQRCTYLKETCPATNSGDLHHTCTCSSGAWTCVEDYHCYPPSSCVDDTGTACYWFGNGWNTDPSDSQCPVGTHIGVCTTRPCDPDGDEPAPTCKDDPIGGTISATCRWGQWLCPVETAVQLPECPATPPTEGQACQLPNVLACEGAAALGTCTGEYAGQSSCTCQAGVWRCPNLFCLSYCPATVEEAKAAPACAAAPGEEAGKCYYADGVICSCIDGAIACTGLP